MGRLKLDTSTHINLTKETDKRGVAVPVVNSDGDPVRVCQDDVSGDFYARVFATRPAGDDPKSTFRRQQIDAAVNAGKLIHYSSDEADVTGYWMEVEGYQIQNADRVAADEKAGSAPPSLNPAPHGAETIATALPGSADITAGTIAQPATETAKLDAFK